MRAPAVGEIVGDRYRIVGLLGEGASSAVFEAERLGTRETVALKMLHPSLADDEEAVARLMHEAELLRSIGHPNICAGIDFGRWASGGSYLVMERLRGESLADRLARGPMGFSEVQPVAVQVLAALSEAHERGVLHRDLKPANVFLERDEAGGAPRAKLLDFGVAIPIGPRAADEARKGTPYYMAPEQARGDRRLDARVDLWAVGVMLYEALSGRRPFEANGYNALVMRILTAQPKPLDALVPGLPPAVSALVAKAISKDPDRRFRTAQELAWALERAGRVARVSQPQAVGLIRRSSPPAAWSSAGSLGPGETPLAEEELAWDEATDVSVRELIEDDGLLGPDARGRKEPDEEA